ncbi:hypothetical protein DFH94DRAFT_785917 [Russula ochroleuca]|uniref:PH domain-containing protein n=1 Tax=Russula ochroleuca TaxID=152965 RepID=A0A9P5MN91_9AGAM|nr:hypothetical protein DFH94DRAFT_785917 [Russula ochroleuca]
MYRATQRHPRFDCESPPSSAVKMPLSPSMEFATPHPQVTQLKGHSKSLHGRRKGSLDALLEEPPTSMLIGTAGLVPKLRQSSFSSSTGSTPSLSYEKHESSSSGGSKGKSPKPLRRSASLSADVSLCASPRAGAHTLVDTVLVKIGTSDHEGWMRKRGGNFNTWRNRFLVLKGSRLYWLESESPLAKVEDHVNVVGCRIVPDENIDPGSYGFKLLRGSDCAHFFSSDDQTVVREWVKALLKPNIKRDHMNPIMSPADIHVVSLEVAQAMNPRPPSPNSVAATQRNIRRENSKRLSMRSEATLTKMQSMPLLGRSNTISSRSQAGSFTSRLETKSPVPLSASAELKAPVRPPRDARRNGLRLESGEQAEQHQFEEQGLMRWANGHLPGTQIDPTGSNCGGLELLRIADSIKNLGSSYTPDNMFPHGPDNQILEELFSLIDFLLVEDKVGPVDINDVRRSKRDKIIQMLRALRAWESHRAILQPVGMSTPLGGPSQAVV